VVLSRNPLTESALTWAAAYRKVLEFYLKNATDYKVHRINETREYSDKFFQFKLMFFEINIFSTCKWFGLPLV
jgi:hypothetical protein